MRGAGMDDQPQLNEFRSSLHAPVKHKLA